MRYFDADFLTGDDYSLAARILGGFIYDKVPDLTIAPDGKPYLYRWHILRTHAASVYFHIQVASDPERPLHDHPWDNCSNILSGGYDELWDPQPWLEYNVENRVMLRQLRNGDIIFRKAGEAHRLILPPDIPYSMSLFSCGPKVREWGFWYPEGWRSFTEVTRTENGVSVHMKPESANEL